MASLLKMERRLSRISVMNIQARTEMKYRKLLPKTVRELRALGLEPEIHNGGKHIHVVFINDFGVRCRLTFSNGNGGSFRTYKNTRANLRRMLRAQS